MPDVRVVIPARLASERLPDKPLALIGAEPMIVHVWRRAAAAGVRAVIVAADDESITTVARQAGADAELTRHDHTSGTDRIAEVAERRGWAGSDIVVNVQGDEPLLPTVLIRQVADLLAATPAASIATLAVPITDTDEWTSPDVVKVVTDRHGLALYFSRAPIPFPRGKPATFVPDIARRHVGLYAYRVDALLQLAGSAPASAEGLERLEQLRALDLGMRIVVADAVEPPGMGVDTPEDLERVRVALAGVRR